MDQALKQWKGNQRKRKRGEDGNTRTWISRERKELFRWKTSFIVFKGLSFDEK